MHEAPGHMNGRPHVDVRRRTNSTAQKYLLKDDY